VNEASTEPARGKLSGRRVLITRPRELGQALARQIESAGGRAILFPTLEIAGPPHVDHLQDIVGRLETFDLAIFISPTAVQRGLAFIRAGRVLPPSLRVAAIGRGSARELERHGIVDIIAPAARADSESLLALPEMRQVEGRSILIVRGVGGREVLGNTLAQRGAQVEYAECYRRVRPPADAAGLLALARGEVDAVTAMSTEALTNLFDMVGGVERGQLCHTPVFVPHVRIVRAARQLQMEDVVLADPGDEGMVAALIRYFAPPV